MEVFNVNVLAFILH